MHRCRLSFLGLLFAVVVTNGQTVSPLFQVMSSNSLINRPDVFRELQTSIGDQYKDVKPGLNLDYLYSRMSQARADLLKKIVPPRLAVDPAGMTVSLAGRSAVIPFQNDGHKKFFDVVQDTIQQSIRAGIQSIVFPETEKKAVLASLLLAIATSDLGRDVSVNLSPDDYVRELSRVVIAVLLKSIQEEISGRVDPEVLNSEYTKDLLNGDLVDAFNDVAEKVTAIIKDKIIRALGTAENEVAKAIDQSSQGLISGNFGVGVTEGKGAFAGGVYVLVTQREDFQLGLYLNGQLQKGDSTKPTESLVGIQCRMAFNNTQLDLLYSGLFGDKDFRPFQAEELGLGLTYRVNNDMIAGVAYFNLFAHEFSPLHVFGITFKGTSPEAPGVLLGANLQGTDVKPVFQLSFPVLPAK